MLDLNKYSQEKIEEITNNIVNSLEENAKKTSEIGNVERPTADASHHKGYISKDTKVCYNLSEGYYMKTTDYINEFVEYVRKNNLHPSPHTIFKFINDYFGKVSNTDNRSEMRFKDISDFRHSDEAFCTERAALANNILSFLGMETWFCDGSIYGSKGEVENHAFVFVRGDSGKYIIYDPSYTVAYNNESRPFIRNITEQAAARILNSSPHNPSIENLLTVPEYYFKEVDGKVKVMNSSAQRVYGVGVQIEELMELVNSRNER